MNNDSRPDSYWNPPDLPDCECHQDWCVCNDPVIMSLKQNLKQCPFCGDSASEVTAHPQSLYLDHYCSSSEINISILIDYASDNQLKEKRIAAEEIELMWNRRTCDGKNCV